MSGIIGGAGSKSGIIGETELEYEEGTFDVTFVATTSGTITIDSNHDHGDYVRVGNMVHINGHFRCTGVSSPVGQFQITNLPFTCGGTADRVAFTMWWHYLDPGHVSAGDILEAYVSSSNSNVRFDKKRQGSISGSTAPCIRNGTELNVTGTYEIA